MKSLLDKCCDKCTHSLENFCDKYFPCRTDGPLCHQDQNCIRLRDERKRQIQYGVEGCKVLIGMGTDDIKAGAEEVMIAFFDQLRLYQLNNVEVSPVGSLGWKGKEVMVEVRKEGAPRIFYANVNKNMVERIVSEHLKKGNTIREWILAQLTDKDTLLITDIPQLYDLEFFNKQTKILTAECGLIDPKSLEEYINTGGGKALNKMVREIAPEEAINTIIEAELKGRGNGLGYLTGVKWAVAAFAENTDRVFVANALETEETSDKDRLLLEGNPFLILEGMAIGALAIGAKEAYICINPHYELAIERLKTAIKQAQDNKLLGANVLGTTKSLEIKLQKGPTAFVSGEETSLIKFLQGEAGFVKAQPPTMAEQGLWDKPTIINNVETIANIPKIIFNGLSWYRNIGSVKSPGTKLVTISGDIENEGVAEIPLGMSLRQLIFDVGGGLAKGKAIKAIHIGGVTGGYLPLEKLDIAFDYEALLQENIKLGLGTVEILGEEVCLIDFLLKKFSRIKQEVCGECIPCREGSQQIYQILKRITQAQGQVQDLTLLEELATYMKETSLCDFGHTASFAILSSLTYFKKEYREHIEDRKCTKKVCPLRE